MPPGSTDSEFADLGRIPVIIPTYNEKDNVSSIVSRVRAATPEVHVPSWPTTTARWDWRHRGPHCC